MLKEKTQSKLLPALCMFQAKLATEKSLSTALGFFFSEVKSHLIVEGCSVIGHFGCSEMDHKSLLWRQIRVNKVYVTCSVCLVNHLTQMFAGISTQCHRAPL